MFKRFWGWITGNSRTDLNIHIEVKDLDKLIGVLSKFQNRPVIIEKRDGAPEKHGQTTIEADVPIRTPKKERKKLVDDPADAADIAQIFAADGIQKATDKTGSDITEQSEGKSTDDQVSSLRQLHRNKGK